MLIFESERAREPVVGISPDNRFLAATSGSSGGGSGGLVRLWMLADPAAEPVELRGGPAMGFLPDGRLVVAEGAGVLLAHPDAPHRAAVRHRMPDELPLQAVLPGGELFSLKAGILTLCRVHAGGVRTEAEVGLARGASAPTAVSPCGTRIAVAASLRALRGRSRSAVWLYAMSSGEYLGELEAATGNLASLVWSPCGRFLAGILGAKLAVWSVESGNVTGAASARPGAPGFAGDRPRVPAGELEAGGTRLFRSPRFHPSGRFLAAGGANVGGGVYSWDVGTWHERTGYCWPVGPVASLSFSPDGTLAAAAGEKGRILVWDVE